MQHIWSPWRMTYIQSSEPVKDCVFCRLMRQPDGPDNLIAVRGERAFVILNRFPYTSGHCMVVPYEHQPSLELLEAETRAEMMELTSRVVRALREEYRPDGFNLGMNIGEAAGAGIAEHVHLHIVPRWGGDTNFMSSISETRVLPETLEQTYARILNRWGKI